jgi:hypothetical protein
MSIGAGIQWVKKIMEQIDFDECYGDASAPG